LLHRRVLHTNVAVFLDDHADELFVLVFVC
jgi:hypothetical protein